MTQTIRVHVTHEQRLFLEFLVRRYRTENETTRADPRLKLHNSVQLNKVCDENQVLCEELIYELQQAGT